MVSQLYEGNAVCIIVNIRPENYVNLCALAFWIAWPKRENQGETKNDEGTGSRII